MSIKEYSSLHNHTHFSVMDGITLPEELIKTAKEKGIRSIAVTDHGHMHAIADVYIFGKKYDVRTLFGIEGYIIDSLKEWRIMKQKHDDEKKKKIEELDDDATNTGVASKKRNPLNRKSHLVMVAKNQAGLNNLFKLTHLSHKEGFYNKPRCDKDMLKKYGNNIVATSACMGGVIANKCWQYFNEEINWKDVVREAEEFNDIFNNNFFLELQFNEHEGQMLINDALIKIHNETGIPLVITGDTHYPLKDDWETQELLYMLRSNKTISSRGSDWDFKVRQLYIKSAEEMWESYKNFCPSLNEKLIIEAFENTLHIDSLIENFEPDTHQRLPSLPIDNPFKELGERSIELLKKRNLANKKEYVERLLHELKIIKDKGISNYFLIMKEIINNAKKEMIVGPGRGSAASSLVCYLNGITDIDPIEHKLLFERFINPDRVELPDIDVDFQNADDAKEMLRDMFGEDNVACLSTYGTFQIKGLMKDVARIYDIDHKEINKANKKIESELRVLYKGQDKSTIIIKLEDIERVSPTYKSIIKKYPLLEKHVKKLYNRNRHVGRHACGVIIGDNLPEETAVFTSKGTLQASFTEGIVNKNISAMGFVKFDILSLATLNVIDNTLKLISKRQSRSYEDVYREIDPSLMNVNDKKVLDTVFCKGNFAGIFQFTEKGIRRLSKKIKPDCFEDVSAICSLYRPGPLGSKMDKMYAKNKENKENIKYDHPLLKEILEETHGCLVYQEQVLKIGNQLGKMSMKDTNRLRKLLLKKDKSKTDDFLKNEKEELYNKFINGCKENDFQEDKAKNLWEDMQKFGGYGFNSAHSKSYTMISMQTAYLRTYYPLEFFASVLTCAHAGSLQEYVDDIKRQGFKILPVDINKSKGKHVIEGDKIRLSFSSVLGLGPSAIEKIVVNQPYDNFLDFIYKSKASKTSVVPLIKVGAFSDIEGEGKVNLLEQRYELFLSNPKYKTKKLREEFERKYFEINDVKEHEQFILTEYENELLGFNLRGSAFEIYDRKKKIKKLISSELVMNFNDFVESDMEIMMIPAVIKDIRERAQKNGKMMAFLKFLDIDGYEWEAPVFSVIWTHVSKILKKNSVYVITFNRKLDEPYNVVVGKPGWAHSASSSVGYFINIDELEV